METGWPETLQEAILYFAVPENCDQFMIAMRWEDGNVRCPHCGSDDLTHLAKVRLWKCCENHPRQRFSLKVGTIFEDSPLSLEKWLPAAWLVIICKNGVSSYEIARDLGVTQKTAWFMLHRIRVAMQTGTFQEFAGEIEADETFIGGKVENMSSAKQARLKADGRKRRGVVGKAIVSGILGRNSKTARVKAPSKRSSIWSAYQHH